MGRKLLIFVFAFSCFAVQLYSQPREYFTRANCVEITATTQASPAKITLSWRPDNRATTYYVYKKPLAKTSWGDPIATLSGITLANSYTDQSVALNTLYEYKVKKTFYHAPISNTSETYGYITTGINCNNLIAHKGRIIVVVDETFSTTLATEVNTFLVDLFAEGYIVHRIDVSRTATVKQVKDKITQAYNMDPTGSRGVILIGHVPVPYSGYLAVDGHEDHHGAVPADIYYGDLTESNWTDVQTIKLSYDPRNYNSPGDGKFDQNLLNSSNLIEMWVGRIDFSGMTFYAKSELQLLKDYFARNHAYRTKQTVYERKALVTDNSRDGTSYTGAGAASVAYRSFAPMVGSNNITDAPGTIGKDLPKLVPVPNYLSALQNGNYLFSHAADGGRTPTASRGDSLSFTFTSKMWSQTYNLKTVFSSMFGSYHHDWDKDNAAMKCALASGALTSMWISETSHAGFGYHNMGMGASLGENYLLFHNRSSQLYQEICKQTFKPVYQAILGDPTLKIDIIYPPSRVNYLRNSNGYDLSWTASPEPGIAGYNIYLLSHGAPVATWVKLNSSIVTTTSFNGVCTKFDNVDRIVVKAVKLIVTPSGSYYVESAGVSQWIPNTLKPDFSVNVTNLNATITNRTVSDNTNVTYKWEYSDNTSFIGQNPPAKIFTSAGAKTVKLTVYNSCRSVTVTKNITVGIPSGTFAKNGTVVPEWIGDGAEIRVYPNPSNTGIFTAEIGNQISGGLIRIFDGAGKIIMELKPLNSKVTIDLSGRPKGIYLLEFVDRQGKSYKKTLISQ